MKLVLLKSWSGGVELSLCVHTGRTLPCYLHYTIHTHTTPSKRTNPTWLPG